MPDVFNIYCDESAHLEHDGNPAMALGAIKCPAARAAQIAIDLRALKRTHGLSPQFEIKWTKISPAQVQFYLAVVDYFFDNDDITYRSLVVPNKTKLNHTAFAQNHDAWYYKMYFQLLNLLLTSDSKYRVYLDVKDTTSSTKVRKLHEVLCNSHFDFDREILDRVQAVRSHEVEQIQLCDILTGALMAANRGTRVSSAKEAVISKIKTRSNLQLTRSTLPSARKVNVFVWEPRASA